VENNSHVKKGSGVQRFGGWAFCWWVGWLGKTGFKM